MPNETRGILAIPSLSAEFMFFSRLLENCLTQFEFKTCVSIFSSLFWEQRCWQAVKICQKLNKSLTWTHINTHTHTLSLFFLWVLVIWQWPSGSFFLHLCQSDPFLPSATSNCSMSQTYVWWQGDKRTIAARDLQTHCRYDTGPCSPVCLLPIAYVSHCFFCFFSSPESDVFHQIWLSDDVKLICASFFSILASVCHPESASVSLTNFYWMCT